MIDNEQRVHDDLRDKLISRSDAIVRVMGLRYPAAEAMAMVDEWIDAWEFQADVDDEREQGWSA